jgi:hypothetical protein
MKSLSFATITLLTCTAQIFCAASSSSLSLEEMADNYLVQRSMMYNLPGDGFAIAAYHERVPTDPSWYPEGPATANQFGVALIPASPLVAATIHWSRELFNKKGSTAPYFIIDDTNSIDLSTNFFAKPLCEYTRDPMYGNRYLLLCPYKDQAEIVKTLTEKDAANSATLEEMFAFIQKILPATTFVLFDAGIYCEYRAVQPISHIRREMRAWTETWKEIQKNQPKPRAKSAEMAPRIILTSERKTHIRTGSLDENKLEHLW